MQATESGSRRLPPAGSGASVRVNHAGFLSTRIAAAHTISRMDVIVAKTAGFCWGVQRAIEKARALARGEAATVWTDGPLIHNRQMLDQLRTERIVETGKPEDLRDGVLLIRAHGIPPERRAALGSIKVPLFDATCPDVARIQGTIRKHARRGFHTIIFGEPGHPEVLGLLGFAEGRGHTVLSPEDVARLPAGIAPVCLVSQSTQFPGKFAAVAGAVRARYPDAVVVDTICASTRRRQQEVIDLSRQVDALVVAGGRQSANTLHLVEIASALKPTLHVETGAELDPAWFRGFRRVGLTAGASTPDFVIREVERRLAAIEPE